jgi:hypothetical protein
MKPPAIIRRCSSFCAETVCDAAHVERMTRSWLAPKVTVFDEGHLKFAVFNVHDDAVQASDSFAVAIGKQGWTIKQRFRRALQITG